MDARGGEPILRWFPICKCHRWPLAVNIVLHFLGGFQATFLIRNHSIVHCVEVDLKAALKGDETFDVYHLDTIQMRNVKTSLCGSRFAGSFKLKSHMRSV